MSFVANRKTDSQTDISNYRVALLQNKTNYKFVKDFNYE